MDLLIATLTGVLVGVWFYGWSRWVLNARGASIEEAIDDNLDSVIH